MSKDYLKLFWTRRLQGLKPNKSLHAACNLSQHTHTLRPSCAASLLSFSSLSLWLITTKSPAVLCSLPAFLRLPSFFCGVWERSAALSLFWSKLDDRWGPVNTCNSARFPYQAGIYQNKLTVRSFQIKSTARGDVSQSAGTLFSGVFHCWLKTNTFVWIYSKVFIPFRVYPRNDETFIRNKSTGILLRAQWEKKFRDFQNKHRILWRIKL